MAMYGAAMYENTLSCKKWESQGCEAMGQLLASVEGKVLRGVRREEEEGLPVWMQEGPERECR